MTQTQDWLREYTAQKEQVAAQQAVTVQLLDTELRKVEEFVYDRLQMQLRGYVLAGAPTEVRTEVRVPAGWWAYTLLAATAHPATRLGRWLQAKARKHARSELHADTTTVNRKVCPHGLTNVAGTHLRWLADEREAQAFRWPGEVVRQELYAGVIAAVIVEGNVLDPLVMLRCEQYAQRLATDLYETVALA